LINFDILYFSTDGCINKSLTYLLTYKQASMTGECSGWQITSKMRLRRWRWLH